MGKLVSIVEAEEYKRVGEDPFPRVQGRPEWEDYLKLKQYAASVALRSDVVYDWAVSMTGTTHGLLGNVLGGKYYKDITTIPQADCDAFLMKMVMYDR